MLGSPGFCIDRFMKIKDFLEFIRANNGNKWKWVAVDYKLQSSIMPIIDSSENKNKYIFFNRGQCFTSYSAILLRCIWIAPFSTHNTHENANRTPKRIRKIDWKVVHFGSDIFWLYNYEYKHFPITKTLHVVLITKNLFSFCAEITITFQCGCLK